MEFKFEENITIHVSLDEVERLIDDAMKKAGYQSLDIEPEFETKYENYGEYPFGGSREVRVLVGFKAKGKRL